MKVHSKFSMADITDEVLPNEEEWFGLKTDSDTQYTLKKKLPRSLQKNLFSL